MVAVINKLYNEVVEINEGLNVSEEELNNSRINLKKAEVQLKQAKSSVYQATKIRNELKLKLKKAKNKASGYLSQRRSYGKKNLGKIIDCFLEEDL